MMTLELIVGLVAAQRLFEAGLARHKLTKPPRQSPVDADTGHHSLQIALQFAWLVAVALAVPVTRQPFTILLALFGLLQLTRMWLIVSRGPYRFLRHPIHLVTTAEIALLPMAFGAWEIALAFTVLHAVLLGHRVRLEERMQAVPRLTEATAGDRMRATRKVA